MQIEALKIYCDVVTHHSFSKAAETNGVTQSTASQSVHRLEDYLGAELIDRTSRPWKVTETGRKCFALSRDVLDAYDRLEREIGGSQHLHTAVRVGSIYSVGFSYMNACTREFSAKNPDEELQIEYLHPDVIADRLMSDELDLGIVSYPSCRREFTVIPWLEEKLVLVCSPKHEFAGRPKVGVSELTGRNFVCFDSDLKISREINHALKELNVSRRVAMRFDNIEAIKRAVEDSDFLAILPRPTLERELLVNTLCAVPLLGATLTRPLGIIYKKGRKLTPALEEFIQTLKRMKAER